MIRPESVAQPIAGLEAKHHITSIQDHDPESAATRHRRILLRERIGEIFPKAVIETDVELESELGRPFIADLVVVSDMGAKLSVICVGSGRKRDWSEISALDRLIRESGLRALWLLAGERLERVRGGIPDRTELRSIPIAEEEVALLRIGSPLLYHGPDPRRLHRVFVPARLAESFRSTDLTSFGQIKLPIRSYNLTQLRINSGRWMASSPYDAPLPPPPELTLRASQKLQRALASSAGPSAGSLAHVLS